jgi:hypothetical protein
MYIEDFLLNLINLKIYHMKKLLLFAALLTGSLSQLSAQCTITPGCTTGPTGYCTTPAENTNLTNATESALYNTTIQFSLASSIAVGPTTIAIVNASINSVTGMPAGLTYSTNPASGTFPGGSNACLLLSGTPSAASAGTYTISVTFSVNTSFAPTTQTLVWFLTVDPSGTVGIKSINPNTTFFISPNPATSELTVASGSHMGKIQIVDALGKTVLTHDANYSSQTTINISSLSKGVYFLQMNDGAKISTKKFIKD